MTRFNQIAKMFQPIVTKAAIVKAGADIRSRQTRIENLELLDEMDEGARNVENFG